MVLSVSLCLCHCVDTHRIDGIARPHLKVSHENHIKLPKENFLNECYLGKAIQQQYNKVSPHILRK